MKRTIAILVTLLLCLSLFTACSDKDAPTTSSGGSTAPSGSGSGSETGESSGVEVYTVGALLNVTGWFSSIDSSSSEGLYAMAAIINEDGGIWVDGRNYIIEIDLQDGQSEATGVRNGAQILANSGRKYLIVGNCFFIEGSLDIFNSNGIMTMMNMNSMNFEALNPKWPYSFWFNCGSAQWIVTAIETLRAQYPEVRSIVYLNDDDGNSGTMTEYIRICAERSGLEYIDNPILFDPNLTDFSGIALQTINTGADATIGNYSDANASAILKELRNAGSDIVMAMLTNSSIASYQETAGFDVGWNFFNFSLVLEEEYCTDMYWRLYQKLNEMYGIEAAKNLSPNSAESLYVWMQLVQGANSFDVDDVIAYWDTRPALDTITGPGIIGGQEFFGIDRVLSGPIPVSIGEPNGVSRFAGWVESYVR